LTLKTLPFQELPFSNLFSDYCTEFNKLSNFFDFNPFDNHDVIKKISQTTFTHRKELEAVLKEYNNPSLMHPKAIANLDALIQSDEVYTVVTGQQLIVAGGPMFTVYKILTAIEYAGRIEALTGKKVVPVFWLADEDHDYDEIAKMALPFGNEWKSLELSATSNTGKRVADIQIEEDIEKFVQELDDILIPTDFKSEILQILKACYSRNRTHGESFARLITTLFSRFGLILAGSSRSNAQKFLNTSVISLIHKTEEIHHSLEKMSAHLEKKYHRQAAVGSSNWFYVGEDGIRQKLQYENDKWSVSGLSLSTTELIDKVSKNPGIVSPNVFLRPLLQDKLLPNLAYIAGPGEVSYYAQMKDLYQVCGQSMPIIVPRFSASILEGAVKKSFEELPFRLVDYNERIEDLESRFLKDSNILDVNEFIGMYKSGIEALADSRIQEIEILDKSLVGTLQKVKSDQLNLLENLRSKMIKSAKNSLEVQIKRINKVQFATFPNRNLQERELAFIYLLNKYGIGVIDTLYDSVVKSDFKRHHIEVL